VNKMNNISDSSSVVQFHSCLFVLCWFRAADGNNSVRLPALYGRRVIVWKACHCMEGVSMTKLGIELLFFNTHRDENQLIG